MRTTWFGWALVLALTAGCGGGSDGADTGEMPVDAMDSTTVDLPDTPPDDIPADVTGDLPGEMSTDLPLPDIQAELPPDVQAELPADAHADLPDGLPAELPPDIQAELPPDASADLPDDVPTEVPPEVPAELPAEVPAELPVDLPGELPPVSDEGPSAPDIADAVEATPFDFGSTDAGPDVPAKYETCLDLFPCAAACGNDQACRNACWAEASSQARIDIVAFESCMTDECPDCGPDTPCDQCRQEAILGTCRDEAAACIVPGTLTCAATIACVQACPAADAVCGEACLKKAAPGAQLLLNPLGQCLMSACPEIETGVTWSVCIQTAVAGTCKPDFDACTAQTSLP